MIELNESGVMTIRRHGSAIPLAKVGETERYKALCACGLPTWIAAGMVRKLWYVKVEAI